MSLWRRFIVHQRFAAFHATLDRSSERMPDLHPCLARALAQTIFGELDQGWPFCGASPTRSKGAEDYNYEASTHCVVEHPWRRSSSCK
jgi:hypothetical protein